MKDIKQLIQTYNAILAGAYPADENKVLDKIQELCNSQDVEMEQMFESVEGDY
jgi:hypothetical protein